MLSRMDTRVSMKFYLIPLFYIGLIGALLYLQFAREEPFHLRFGQLEVNGHVIAGKSDPPALADITLRINGLSFSFSRATPVLVDSEGGSQQPVALKSYKTISNGIEVTFTSGVGLRFIVAGNDSLSILPSTPDGMQITSVSLPYSVARSDSTDSTPGIPALAITHQSPSGPKTYVLSLPFNSEVRSADHTLLLTSTGGTFGPTVYNAANRPNENPVVYWFGENGKLPDATEYTKAVNAYADKAWNGWTTSRYDAKAGTWEMRDGSPSFKQNIVAAILAESLRRGSYSTWFPEMQHTSLLHAQDITLDTTPYFGSLEKNYARFEGTIAQQLLSDQTELQQTGNAAFGIGGLLKFLVDHGTASTVNGAITSMKAADVADMNMAAILNLLDDELTAQQLGYESKGFELSAKELITRHILPAIIRTGNGFYLQTESGTSDLASSVFAGYLLMAQGKQAKDQVLEGIGRELVLSALALSDNEGFLPGRLTISGDRVEGSEGFLAPEKIYKWVLPSAYYPHETPLTTQVGQGVWAWTASRITSVDSTAKALSVTFRFPAGAIEHIVLHGIKPFLSVKMFGVQWGSVPQFEQYASGWAYQKSTQTLFIKLQHRSQDETVTLEY